MALTKSKMQFHREFHTKQLLCTLRRPVKHCKMENQTLLARDILRASCVPSAARYHDTEHYFITTEAEQNST